MLTENQRKVVSCIRRESDERLYNLFWKCMNIKCGKGMELFYGKDIQKAFPTEEYKVRFLSEFKPDNLYYIKDYNYQTNVLEMAKVKIWKE
jgi:hypothetical protein